MCYWLLQSYSLSKSEPNRSENDTDGDTDENSLVYLDGANIFNMISVERSPQFSLAVVDFGNAQRDLKL